MIIGLHGPSSSGKDTVYRIISEIVEREGYPVIVQRIASADVVKKCVCGTFDGNLTLEDIEDYKNDDNALVTLSIPGRPPYTTTLRRYISNFCNQGHRDVLGQDFWIDQSVPKGLDHEGYLGVVTDVRFANEIDRILDVGGEVFHLYGSPNEGKSDDRAEQRVDIDLPSIDNSNRRDNFSSLTQQLEQILMNLYTMGRLT